jgi:N-methylhydantoinase A/oxoprolinase/acetone carboxylase beta subunit
MKRIGIDVGGTNTDAVLLHDGQVVAAVKSPTTADVTGGIRSALGLLLAKAGPETRGAEAVIVGTTHFLNAVIERQRLNKVTAVRLCLPASASVPPFADWPTDLRDIVRQEVVMLPGGFEVDGREIAPFDERRMREAAARIRDSGVEAVAVSGVFSPLRADHELRAAAILAEMCPGISVTLSKDLGRIGLLERENVTILNAALANLARAATRAFEEAIESSGLGARLFMSQNDGTLMSSETARRMPVLCFTSGPTNSMRGAAHLSGLKDAMVIDVGGTSSDIGVLRNGFPREANTVVEVGGVRTLFRMPDVMSLALGGGTRVRENPLRLGPDSVGYALTREARVFGGNQLTSTDVAVASGLLALGDAGRVHDVAPQTREWFMREVRGLIEEGIDRMKTQAGDVPLIAVGGGSFLVPRDLRGVSEVVAVDHHDVANAVGAAIAQVGGEVDQVYENVAREEAISDATGRAIRRAVEQGADPRSVTIVEVEDLPLSYVAGNTRRIRARAVGDLA